MIPRFEPPIGVRELAAALSWSKRDDLATFEAAFADVMEQKHAIAFGYGRTALIALLRCLGLDKREILCPAYTCVVVPNAIVYSGNTPVFVDSGLDANARLDRVQGLICGDTGAFVATSIFGNPVDLESLDAIRKSHPELPIIQDCAHSFVCHWRGRPVHREGVAAIFGLNVSKTMTSIFGGMVTTDDDTLALALRRQRATMSTVPDWRKALARLAYAVAVKTAFWPPLFAITDRLRRAGILDRFTRYYDESRIDMPDDYLSPMTALEARVGTRQTTRLHEMIAARQTYDHYYRTQLANVNGLSWVCHPEGASISHVTARVASRNQLQLDAARLGVELGHVIEYSVPELAAYRRMQTERHSFPVSKMLSQTVINLPTTLRFNRAKADKVIDVLQKLLQDAAPPPELPFD